MKFKRYRVCHALLVLSLVATAPGWAVTYYVNDGSTNGNVYTTALGNDANNGLTPSTPKRTVTNLLASYTLTAGDVVYIDTGLHTNYTVTVNVSGAPGNPIRFIGSTNRTAGGTVFNRTNTSFDVWSLSGAGNVEITDISLRGGRDGIVMNNSPSVRLERLEIRNNSRFGVYALANSHNLFLLNSVMALNGDYQVQLQASTNGMIASSVLWGNLGILHRQSPGIAYVSNSVLRASGLGNFVYRRESAVLGNHNVYVLDNDAALASLSTSGSDAIPRLYDWQTTYASDSHSTVLDPLFANPAAFDFHERSQFGRFLNGSFTNDNVTSPLIDFGPRSWDFANETSPNGGRVNAGRFGNTVEASRSGTNRFLLALTYNDGGVASGTAARVTWVAGNAQPSDTVRLEYSLDGGGAWTVFATGVPATNEVAFWNTTLHGSSGAAKWRVRYEAFTNIVSENTGFFSVRNTNLAFFVNNTSTVGNVYTTVAGQSNNLATAASPKDSLVNLFRFHTLSPGDAVYIDTGLYVITNTLGLTYRERGGDGNPLRFIGSTNFAAGGTVFDRGTIAQDLMVMDFAPFVHFFNLTLRNSRTALTPRNSGNLYFERVIFQANGVSGGDFAASSPNLEFRNSIFNGNTQRAFRLDGTNISVINCLVYGPVGITLGSTASARFQNNLFKITSANGAVYQPLSGTILEPSDYNMYCPENGANIAIIGTTTNALLSQYQSAFNREWRSTVLQPRFANIASNDFHLRSQAGRWENGAFVNDVETSPAIDFGDPTFPFSLETAPNGGRINAGPYGNTLEASRSRTNAWLLALTYNEGGQFNAPGDTVYWNYGNLASNALVRIEFSFNSGSSWTVIDSNILVGAGSYTFTSTNFTSSRFARWRIVLQTNTTVVAANVTNFTFRSGAYRYYVNDGSTANDVFCTAPGNDANLGTTPDLPKATIQNVLANYQLDAGDILYVDTGVYSLTAGQTIGFNSPQSGTNNNPVIIQGSTNRLAGGTIIQGPSFSAQQTAPVITLNAGLQDVTFRDLTIRQGNYGVSMGAVSRVGFERLTVETNRLAGLFLNGAQTTRVSHSVIRLNQQDGVLLSSGSQLAIDHSVIWMNISNAIQTAGGRIMITNSILGASGNTAVIYRSPTATNIVGNYNNLYAVNEASVGFLPAQDRLFNTLSAWQDAGGMERMSLDADPLFANPAAGDFHLRSQTVQGRFDPILGWVTDTTTSPLIDAGDPSYPFGLEPAPNGGRVNIGLYGNTPEASRVDFPRLWAGNLRQGGFMRGTATLHWVAAGLASNTPVRVEYSPDGGESWSILSTGVAASVERYDWNTTTTNNTPAGLWRITVVASPSITDQTTNFFGVRNGPLAYYINNESIDGNRFTTAPGAATNWVASSNRPLNNLSVLVDRYDLEPGDTVYLDTGTYWVNQEVRMGPLDRGSTSAYVSIVGATVCGTGGKPAVEWVGPGASSFAAIRYNQSRHVAVSNILIRGAGSAIRSDRSSDLSFDGLWALNSLTNGVDIRFASNVVFRRSVLAHNQRYAFWGVTNQHVNLLHSMVWSNQFGGVFVQGGSLGVTNSVMQSSGSGRAIFTAINGGVIRSDYNNILPENLSDAAQYNGRLSRFVSGWQLTTTNDLRSLSHPPGFADPDIQDFHLLSTAGRFDPDSCAVVTDAVSSVMIDAGSPASDFAAEPAPNGGRADIGIFGNHPEASRSATNARLMTLSLNSGGSVRGTVPLYWFVHGPATGHLVTVSFSIDNGATWSNIAVGVNATLQTVNWDTTSLLSSPLVRWRVVSDNQPTLAVTSAVPFSINNGPISFYVNDAVADADDVYTFAPGDEANDGLTPFTPADSLATIFARYQPAPGDVVYVDTGHYTQTNTIMLNSSFSGVGTNVVTVQGSTNWQAGGARFDQGRGGPAFQLNELTAFHFNDLVFTNGARGFLVQASSNLVFRGIHFKSGSSFSDNSSYYGFRLDAIQNITLDRVIIQNVTNRNLSAGVFLWTIGSALPSSLHLVNSVLWSNSYGFRGISGATLTLSNSVIQSFGRDAVGVEVTPGTTLRGDYNNHRTEDGAALFLVNQIINNSIPAISAPVLFQSLAAWQTFSGQESNSLAHDPRFADPGEMDFSLLSDGGRWTPTGLVTDSVTSAMIDAGNPAFAFVAEPAPNGGRVNIGPDGNSGRASLSTTNRALIIQTLNDGGIASGTSFPLRWDYRGDFTGQTVRIQVSTNSGLTWTTLATNHPALSRVYSWNTTEQPSGLNYRWRINDETFILISAINDKPFAVRNTNFSFYVNNSETTGLVYTTASGNPTNSGLSADQPMDGLQRVLDTYDLEAGDTVYVDTGVYVLQQPITIRQEDTGNGVNPVRIIGSTNVAAGGTQFRDRGIVIDSARGLRLEHLRIAAVSNAVSAGVNLTTSTNVVLESVSILGAGHGVTVRNSDTLAIRYSAIVGSQTNGVNIEFGRTINFEHSILWTNNNFGFSSISFLSVHHSILGARGAERFVYAGASNSTFQANHNVYHLMDSARLGRVQFGSGPDAEPFPRQYINLVSWTRDLGPQVDAFSMLRNPLFAEADAGNFHLRSQAGRWNPLISDWVLDVETSPAIDAGDPVSPFDQEPEPNGARLNIGLHGNTALASKTPTNAVYIIGSVNNGGSVFGTNVLLYWIARGDATGHSARVEVSSDEGNNWLVLASNVPPGTSSVVWDTTLIPSSVLGLWRVVSEVNPAVVAQTEQTFAIRNGPILFYLNDGSTNGNVYTTAPGSDTNNAATPATPKRNLSALLNRYSLEPGDVVYVDTGLYTNNTTIVIDQLDRGFRLVGSTNNVAGGTVFAFTNTAIGLSLFQAPTTTVENIRFQGANTAIEVRQSPDVVMRGLQIYDSSVGVLMRDSPRVRIENSLLRNLETAVDMRLCQQVQMVNNVFWSNTASAVFISEASASMINSVIGVLGSNRFGYNLRFNSSLTADYNLYFLTNGGAVATEVVTNAPFMIWENVTAWRRDTGRDLNSLATDPLFANPLSGDFHPRSAGGRFNPATGLFVTDAETSPLIDAGFPVSDFSRETSPNGGRINIGMYGNTPEASRTPAAARLRVASLNDGGRVRGDNVPLTWRAYGAATGHTVRLEYSINNGAAWSVIQSNVAANSEIFFWNTGTSATWFARWRVISENNPAVSDQSAKPFQLGNAALSLYVNDTFTNNLVYTTAPGNDGNLGISPSAPRLTIQSVINDYDLEPGDTVYVDTGEYIIASPIRIGRFDAWNTMSNLLPLAAGGVSIRIQGSTNELAGGSRIIGTLGINVFELNEAYGVHLRDLQISHFPVASGGSIQAIASRFGLFEWLRMRDGQNGISLNNSSQARIRHVVASGFTDHGIVARNFSVAVDVQQSILWSNRIGVYVTEQAQLNIRNSVLAALGMDTVGLRRNDGPLPQAVGTLLSDYNLFWAAPLAFVAELQGNQYPGARLRFQRLVNWTRTTGLDINSLAADPQFANASQGDWHPRSPYGRFIAGVGYVTNASEAFSPLIDLGDPTLSFAQEPAPNGNRVNAGLYGNTSQASLSPTSGVLQVLTFNDGGSGAGDIELRWNVAGPASSHLLTLDFSNDGGVTWTNITSNVVALTKSYAWDSVPYGAAAAGLWRVVSQNNPALAATNQNFFALRQGGSIPYYVNGPSVDQAVFCTAPGNDDNNGFLPSSPKATLQSLLDAVDLEPGDVVYVDTGVYAQNAAINIGEFDSGVATNPVVIRGSTNVVAGGTIFDRITGLGNGILIDRAEGILLRDITVRNAAVGVFLELCNDIALQNVTLRNNTFAGVRVAGTRGTLIRNSLFFNNPTNAVLVGLFGQGSFATPGNVDIINNTFWGNRYSVHVAQGGSATAYNNLIQANGPDSRIYFMGLGVTNVIADYNAYFRQSSALMGERERLVGGNDFYTRLIDWQRDRGNDLHSLSHNPLVANAAGGDFHLLSANGRTLPNGSVVFDPPGTFSPLIDAGQPAAAWTNEPAPNGGRVNIGRYGNTAEASRSRTNGWLLALSLNDGGRIFGTNIVRWTAGGWPTSSLVRFEYANNGVDYSIIASNIPVYLDGFTWNVSSEPVTQLARWRVISEDDSNTVSVAGPFTIKNNPLVAYVNNDSIVNNVYTVAPGNETNDGLSPATPLNDPATAIERFPLSEGDIIYIDTGTYVITNAVGMRIGLFGEEIKAGQPGDPIRIIGSTNRAAGGTTIIGHPDTQFGLRISNTKHISIEHLNFSGNTNGVSMVGVEDVRFRWVNVSSNITGFNMNNAGGASFRHCSAWNNTVGLFLDGTFSSVSWDYGVFWSNRIAGIRHTYGFMSVSNSILGAPSSNSILIEVNSGFATIRGNYNLYYPGPNLNLFRDTLGNVFFRTLRGWQNARGIDANSLVVDPLFADPGLGNFHLRSDQGRFNPTSGTFVLDADTSWGIDAGAPSDPFNLETQPNGDRVNVGVFGNTPLASRSTTNPALFVGSLRDGGTAGNPQLLTWLTRGLVSNATVRLEYTPNDGLVWETVATNVPAINGQYVWNNGALDSTPLARWRIILESNPVVSDITEAVFTLRNGPIAYYVNDSNTLGNVYTTVPGSPLNNGITVSTPVHSVSTIIDRFELIGGDVVYVDTGYYPITENIVIRADDAGNEDARVHIQGSTNRLAGGTVIHRSSTNAWSNNPENDEAVFELVNARYIELSDMIVQNANAGVFVNNPFPRNDWNLFRNLEIRDGGFYGIRLNGSSENTLERVVIHRMVGIGIDIFRGSSNRVVSSVIWSNQNGGIYTMLSETMITNSVLHAFGQVTNSALILSESTVSADYNNYFIQGSASYALVDGEPITGLPQWYFRTTQDVHSISVEPLFHDPANSDFHPRSISGRFNPATQSFVFTDTDTSWLIDTGDPLSGVGNESAPNGGRRNIGLFGGTAQASRSRTEPWVLAITAMAGGRPGGIFPLHWAYGNIDPTNRVNLDYSVDSGTNWNVIATDVPINLDGFLWNSLNADPFQSPTTKWRVQVVGATNVVDETDRTFGLNAPFRFFINNTSTVGNVFTTAPGDDNNLGISSNFPKASLRSLLDFWDLDPEDSIYIDTGVYLLTTNDINTEARLNQAGSAQHPVSVIGSPNGVLWDGSALKIGPFIRTVLIIGAPYMVWENISVRSGLIEGRGTNIILRNWSVNDGSIQLSGAQGTVESFYLTNALIEVVGRDIRVEAGYVINGSLRLAGTDAYLGNTVVAGEVSPLVTIEGTNVTVVNNTLVANRTAIRQLGGDSRSTLRNNIIIANGAPGTAFAIERQAGVVFSDYNLFFLRNGAWFGGAQDGLWERLLYWQERSGQDTNSLVADPLFANEAGGDYRLRSVTGRWQGGGWVVDGVHSPAIDAGAPFDSFSRESAPNGGRINIGAFGNTEQASRSRTTPWVYAITMNDGGVLRGTNTLRWLAGAMDPTNRVILQYSANAGTNWTTIVAGLPALNGAYSWDTTTASNTLDARWRVVLEGDPSVVDVNDSIFNIRNDVRGFYVNNASTNGNVFTTAAGNNANDGRTPATPKATLENLLATYDTEPADTIYVDTGIYTSSVIQVIWSRGGDSNANMIIRGSTNVAAGGTVLRRPTRSGDAMLLNASYVTVRDMIFENANRGLYILTNRFVVVDQVEARSNNLGIAILGGGNHRITSSRVWNNTLEGGIQVWDSQNVRVENVTFVNNLPYSIQYNVVPNSFIQNNIFYHDVATSNQQFALSGPTGTVLTTFIDYNVYWFGPLSKSNAFIYGSFTNLLPWQRAQVKDMRSAITNPMFHNVTSGVFTLQSQAGRYDFNTRTFVSDTNTSWAIDKGNPFTVFEREPAPSGNRVNVGAYGNTLYASKGSTGDIVFARTGNEFLPITEAENAYPLIWHVLNLPYDLTFTVQYSGDGGVVWVPLQSGVSAYQEYIFWTNSPTFNSFNAKWRIVGEGAGNTNYWDINDGQIRTFFGVHRISQLNTLPNQQSRFVWRGAWNEDYQIQYATNYPFGTNRVHNWQNLVAVTNLKVGGDTPFIDVESTNDRFRVYRVIWLGTNGVPFQ